MGKCGVQVLHPEQFNGLESLDTLYLDGQSAPNLTGIHGRIIIHGVGVVQHPTHFGWVRSFCVCSQIAQARQRKSA